MYTVLEASEGMWWECTFYGLQHWVTGGKGGAHFIDLARVVMVGKGRVHPMIHTGLVSRCTLPLHLGNVTIACVVE